MIRKMKSIDRKFPSFALQPAWNESISVATVWRDGRAENISRACRELTDSDFHWIYANNLELLNSKGRKTRVVYCIETTVIYESIKQAEDMNNCETSGIIRACQNHNRSAAGYHRCYHEDFETIKSTELAAPQMKKSVRCVETSELFYSGRNATKA